MEDTRKGFLTEAQEKQTDDLAEFANKALEAADGLVIKFGDNVGLEMLKKGLVSKYGDEVLPDIYSVVDAVFELLPKKETES